VNLFNVYPVFDVNLCRGRGSYVYDEKGTSYLDFYGGHAVISIGHSHPHYIRSLEAQLGKIGFYSNSIQNPLQQKLADKLGQLSGMDHYELFLCNSGAEANENALKMASFYHPDRKKVIAFKNGFHGRTSAAVNVTDNPKIQSTFNKGLSVEWFGHQEEEACIQAIRSGEACAIILEVIQGVGGLDLISDAFLNRISEACKTSDTILIADEVQSGFGRTGEFFAFQHARIQPDIVSMAKGMGNGFPIGGILLNPEKFNASYGLLGTTYGGNYLACAACLAVLEVIEAEGLIEKIASRSKRLTQFLETLPGVQKVKGRGLMLGAEFDFPVKELRAALVYEHQLFTGSAKNPNVLRLLPPLVIGDREITLFEERLTAGVLQYLEPKTLPLS